MENIARLNSRVVRLADSDADACASVRVTPTARLEVGVNGRESPSTTEDIDNDYASTGGSDDDSIGQQQQQQAEHTNMKLKPAGSLPEVTPYRTRSRLRCSRSSPWLLQSSPRVT